MYLYYDHGLDGAVKLEIMQGFSADDIWNMDESGLFSKARPDTGLPKKLKSVKAVRNQKSDLLLHFLCPRMDSSL